MWSVNVAKTNDGNADNDDDDNQASDYNDGDKDAMMRIMGGVKYQAVKRNEAWAFDKVFTEKLCKALILYKHIPHDFFCVE